MALQATERARDLEAYQADLRAAGLDAPWAEPGPLIRPKASAVQARLWRWADIEPLVRRSAEFMTLGRGAGRHHTRREARQRCLVLSKPERVSRAPYESSPNHI